MTDDDLDKLHVSLHKEGVYKDGRRGMEPFKPFVDAYNELQAAICSKAPASEVKKFRKATVAASTAVMFLMPATLCPIPDASDLAQELDDYIQADHLAYPSESRQDLTVFLGHWRHGREHEAIEMLIDALREAWLLTGWRPVAARLTAHEELSCTIDKEMFALAVSKEMLDGTRPTGVLDVVEADSIQK